MKIFMNMKIQRNLKFYISLIYYIYLICYIFQTCFHLADLPDSAKKSLLWKTQLYLF